MIFSVFSNPVLLLYLIPTLLISLTVHEYFHAFAATKLGDPTARAFGRLTLNPLKHLDPIGTVAVLLFGFGWAKPVPIDSRYFKKPRRDMALVAAAGPLSNLGMSFLGAFFSLLFLHFFSLSSAHLLASFLYHSASLFYVFHLVNLTLFLFNLLPISPLDGSHLLSLILPARANDWIARHRRQLYLGLMLWLLLGSFAYRFLLRIPVIASNTVLRSILRVLTLSGLISDLASLLSSLILKLFSLIPFL
ncbi:MAG: site-2 protease family protein [Eubacteriales bacterium]